MFLLNIFSFNFFFYYFLIYNTKCSY